MLRKLASEARMQRTATQLTSTDDDAEEASRRERDEVRDQRRRDRERDLRMARNKSAASRNADRDVSERVALGQAVAPQSSETLYDQRLFNQSQGMDSGFGEEDSYNIYSKPLFSGSQASANILYKPKKGEDDNYGNEVDLAKLKDTSKFKPDKDFSGVDRSKEAQQRSGPLEFEKEDPFGLDEFLTQAKTGSSKPLDKIGSSGHMSVSSANMEGALGGGSKRGRIDFESSSSSSSSSSSKKHRH
jgi:SNW domain-containing protein 1